MSSLETSVVAWCISSAAVPPRYTNWGATSGRENEVDKTLMGLLMNWWNGGAIDEARVLADRLGELPSETIAITLERFSERILTGYDREEEEALRTKYPEHQELLRGQDETLTGWLYRLGENGFFHLPDDLRIFIARNRAENRWFWRYWFNGRRKQGLPTEPGEPSDDDACQVWIWQAPRWERTGGIMSRKNAYLLAAGCCGSYQVCVMDAGDQPTDPHLADDELPFWARRQSPGGSDS